MNGEPYSVIGVVAENQILREFGPPPDLYVPFQLDPNSRDEGMYFSAVARLKPGVTLDQARERLRTSTGAYRSRFPNDLGPRESFSVVSFREALIGDTRRPLLVLMGAVTLVLLIACTNVANLLLVRVTGRRREIAIRAAMGADRGRIIRQLLTDSALLSLAGGAMGLWLGYGGIRALFAVNTADLPLVGTNGTAVEMDWRMVGFALAVSLATGIVFGLLPAIQGSRADLNSILKGGMGAGALRQSNASAVLVVSEVGLAVTLLVGSALLIRTLAALYAVDRGFDTNHVVTMRMALTGTKYSKSRAVADTIREGLEHIRLLPGVVNASATCCLPLQDGTYDENFDIVGRARTDHREVGWAAVSPGFFEIFRMPVKTSERVRQEGFADNL